jgi:hypothetical protein
LDWSEDKSSNEIIKTLVRICLVFLSALAVGRGLTHAIQNRAQNSAASPHVSTGPKTSPESIVMSLWIMASRGDLLTPDGHKKVGGLFVKVPTAYGKNVEVVSNNWAVGLASATDSNARVDVHYWPVGQIDPLLRFVPAPKTNFMEFGIEYSIALTQTYFSELNVDGTLKKKVPGWKVWLIEGPEGPAFPFTTVNTAIRYVLEKREEAKDPVIQKNADETIAKLLKLH